MIRTMKWNGCYQISADIPSRLGYHQTISLPNYCNEAEALAVEAIIKAAYKRHWPNKPEVKNEQV